MALFKSSYVPPASMPATAPKPVQPPPAPATTIQHFWKVFMSEFTVALKSISNNQRLNVILYVLGNLTDDNKFIGTIQEIADKTGICYRTVQPTIKIMCDNDIMREKQVGVYMVSPALIMKGRDIKKAQLMIEYEDLGGQSISNEIGKVWYWFSPEQGVSTTVD